MHSRVFVSVFGVLLEFTHAPVVASAAENQESLEILVLADVIRGTTLRVSKGKGRPKLENVFSRDWSRLAFRDTTNRPQ